MSLYLDVVLVGEEHGEPVYAQPPPSSGRQTVLQRRAEVLVYHLGLVVTSVLLLGLLLEALPLHDRVIQLSVRIAQLLSQHEQLEALCQSWFRSVPGKNK